MISKVTVLHDSLPLVQNFSQIAEAIVGHC